MRKIKVTRSDPGQWLWFVSVLHEGGSLVAQATHADVDGVGLPSPAEGQGKHRLPTDAWGHLKSQDTQQACHCMLRVHGPYHVASP